MRAGRRSTISCSARCSTEAAAPRSPRRNGSAVAFSKSASAPGFRCRIMRDPTRLVGVDLSEPMLRKARARVAEQKLGNVELLAVMDAERLALPDKSFDVVVAQYVITTVPHPEATLDEFVRVIRPGGENRVGQSLRRRIRAAPSI